MKYIDREKKLAYLQDPLLQQGMIRLLDLAEKSLRQSAPVLSSFLDPFSLQTAQSIFAGLPEFKVACSGGYPEAERQRMVFDSVERTAQDFQLAFMQVQGNFKFCRVSHRDYLGSILGLGISREKIGDLLVTDDGCQVVLEREIADYIAAQWTKVNQVTVRVRMITAADLTMAAAAVQEIKSTVASLRLDAVLGLGFAASRGKLLPEIQAGRVRVNWQTVTEPSHQLAAGDRISCQGKGRLEIKEISGPSQKGRIFVTINRFL